eukprot:gene647-801_t
MNFAKIIMSQNNRKQDVEKTMHLQTIARARKLATYANRITQSSFLIRKQFFINKENGILSYIEPNEEPSAMNMMIQNPFLNDSSGITDMLKNNMVHLIPQITMMTWVNHFFYGFVACKIPFFPLTIRFKSFLQRGIDLASLDVSYVSSLSWYFLCLFGSDGINSIIMGETPENPSEILFQSMVEPGPPGQQAPIHKIYQSEKENIEMVRHEWLLENAEERFLKMIESKTPSGGIFNTNSTSSTESSTNNEKSIRSSKVPLKKDKKFTSRK